jgi:hypothetical protein
MQTLIIRVISALISVVIRVNQRFIKSAFIRGGVNQRLRSSAVAFTRVFIIRVHPR